MRKYNVAFFGTPNFSIPFLNAIILGKDFEVKLVISEPDKKSGRNLKLTESPVAQFAKKNNISVKKPTKLKDFNSILSSYSLDLVVVVAYGKIIPKNILDIPKFGAINIHPSNLPKYRGPAPIQSALLHNEKRTAISVMIMDELMDHGPILAKKFIYINENDDYFSLEEKILKTGPKVLVETIKKYLDHKIKPKEQNHTKASYTRLIKKEDGLIDWQKDSYKINNQIKAYCAWPKAYTILDGKRLIFIKSKLESGKLQPLLVQLEGKNKLNWKDFSKGYKKPLPVELTKKII